MNKTIIEKKYETLVVTIVLLFFFIGFFMGWSYSNSTLDNTELSLEKTRLDLKSFSESLNFIEYFDSNSCNLVSVRHLNEKLSEVAKQLDSLEKDGLSDDNFYLLLKEKHNVNQVLFYTYFKEFSERCDSDLNMILFLFNSSESEISTKQGLVLDRVVENYDTIVLPMDYGFSDNLDYFYNFYKGDSLPTIVVNYNNSMYGFTSFEEVLLFLK